MKEVRCSAPLCSFLHRFQQSHVLHILHEDVGPFICLIPVAAPKMRTDGGSSSAYITVCWFRPNCCCFRSRGHLFPPSRRVPQCVEQWQPSHCLRRYGHLTGHPQGIQVPPSGLQKSGRYDSLRSFLFTFIVAAD